MSNCFCLILFYFFENLNVLFCMAKNFNLNLLFLKMNITLIHNDFGGNWNDYQIRK